MDMESSEKEVLKEMIEMYRDYTLLWDTSHNLYSNKDARNQAFTCLLRIYKKFKPEATLSDVRKKIENMRSTYKKEIKKVKESSGSQEQYVPSLWYYDLMLFLDQKEMVLPGAETVEEEELCLTIRNDTHDHSLDGPHVEYRSTQSSSESSDALSYPAFHSELSTASQNISPPTIASITAKRARMSLTNKQDALMESAAQTLLKGPDSQCGTFGINVAQQLQMMKPDQQAIAQKLISDVLFLGKFRKLTPTATVLATAAASLPVSACGSPTIAANTPYSQPYEHFDHQHD